MKKDAEGKKTTAYNRSDDLVTMAVVLTKGMGGLRKNCIRCEELGRDSVEMCIQCRFHVANAVI